ncbi:MAG: hypothetical protein ACFFD2_12225 [Promethearchaeota archaeon]
MIFKPTEQERAHKYLDNLFTKNRWIKIEHITESKTISQNNYAWLIFTHIAFSTGNNKDDIYQYYLDKFKTYKTIDINGTETNVIITMSKFTKEQMSRFIDNIVIDARQEGFDIPDSEDLKCREMYDYYKKLGMI